MTVRLHILPAPSYATKLALGGAVGTGLIIGSGTALRRGGPLGLLLGYSFVGYVAVVDVFER